MQESIATVFKWLGGVLVLWLVAELFGVDVAALIDKNAHKLFDLF